MCHQLQPFLPYLRHHFPTSPTIQVLLTMASCLILLWLLALPLHLACGEAKASEVHTFWVRDLLPNSICSASPKGYSSSRLQVVHGHGPCSPLTDDQKLSHREVLDGDRERVLSIQRQMSAATAPVDVEKLGRGSPPVNIPARTGSSLGTGNYVVTVGFGTPGRKFSVIFDTGSDLSWIQCAPCNDCYAQEEPVFDPEASSTYAAFLCNSTDCGRLYSNSCSTDNRCRYSVQYGDQSETEGTFGRDVLTLSPSSALPGFLFGCGEANRGLFGRAAGLLGLGRGSVSLALQAARKYGAVFSYCLPSRSSETGYLTIGRGISSNVSYTRMRSVPGLLSFYFADLVAIKVGGKQLSIQKAVFRKAGTLIDSGTVITRLPPAAYAALRTAFRGQMGQYEAAPALSILDTCYNFTGYERVSVPTVALVFASRTEVQMAFSGILYVASAAQACLAFAGNEMAEDVAIVGNMQQKTYTVVYDVAGKKIGFGAQACG
ncbi:aspartyl protease family protein At5g10770-like [Zingiber officinale]|uniref:aspartyl protease family protein At5g10770-like n=1 Tax=Zingiber officinale TaxID=94328 RepID=UPI001C4D54AE|nr:aspartyl protease family protein At5g10770-like [Zingiber officinale]